MDTKTAARKMKQRSKGQALVEYALILILVFFALIVVLQLTGPILGNLFDNTVQSLGGDGWRPEDIPLETRQAYIQTMTAVAENPLAAPTQVPTATATWDPAIPTPTLPFFNPTEATPYLPPYTPGTPEPPAETLTPPPTPEDLKERAPHLETVDFPENWRVLDEPWLGPNDWFGTYFTGTRLDYSGQVPVTGMWNQEMYGPSGAGVIDFPNTDHSIWTNSMGGPIVNWPSSSIYDNFSIRFVREITLAEDTPIRFSAQYSDGFRLWVVPSGQSAANCSATGVSSGEPGTANATYGDNSTFSTDCLLIDDWEAQSSGSSVVRTVPAGSYTLQVDYFDASLDAILRLDMSLNSNPDDTAVSGGGSPISGPIDCGWEQHEFSNNANSLKYDWSSYPDSAMPLNMRCYLEFRGAIYIPAGTETDAMTDPEFAFWDVWQFDGATLGWLEMAEYIPTEPDGNVLDRAAVQWIKLDVHSSPSLNYNWTRHVYDLTAINGVDASDGVTPRSENFLGKWVTFRFAIENRNNLNTRRWYLDDIEFYDNKSTAVATDTTWDLNDPLQEDEFTTSRQWNLNNNNAMGGVCCSFEIQNDFGRYSRHTESPSSSFNSEDMRIHYVEINDQIMGSIFASPDDEGDTGDLLLSFSHGYKIGRYTGLEVQYWDGSSWLPVPGGGVLEPSSYSGTDYKDAQGLTPVDISLAAIPQANFRLRFAMLVHSEADRRYGGWWIDDIHIHREAPPSFLDYPFRDDAEAGTDNWLAGGSWARTTAAYWDGGHSFTDSPGENYRASTDTSFRFIDPIDLNNDSPENIGGNSHGGPAVNPYLTFYHRRDIKSTDAIYVEWRQVDENDSAWKPLWAYVYRMGTSPADNSSRTGLQTAWERVEVSLDTVTYNPVDGDFYDDDILIRFRLYADGFSEGDGVYLDDIRVQDYAETSFAVWPSTDNRTVGGTNFGTGDGAIFSSDVDEADWADRWNAAGAWQAISWEQRQGLQAWHDSGAGQSAAPVYEGGGWSNATMAATDAFSVLEMATIIDLRATDVSERPTLYFWNRYHMGYNEQLVVQVSEELPASTDLTIEMGTRCNNPGFPQCYEQNRGWSEWQTVYINDVLWKSTYSWQREQVDLIPYAASGSTPGSRIRIRFLYDTLDNSNSSNSRDGWYIDNISIEPRHDLNVLQNISSGPFEDPAQNMDNWIGEGNWGLSPDRFRMAGGGAGFTTDWDEYFWDCDQCQTIGRREGGASYTNRMAVGADMFLDVDGLADTYIHSRYRDEVPVTRTVSEIDYDFGTGGPYSGFNERNTFVGRWVMNTTEIGAPGSIPEGVYSITTVSDDGVRVKIEELDSINGNRIGPGPAPTNDLEEWNVIYNWNDHGRTTDMGLLNFENGRFYRVTVEYYERSNAGVITVKTATTAYSFTDSPKQGTGPSFPDIATIANSDSSLIMAGSVNLAGTSDPILQYYTLYEVRGTIRAEISTDGGFTWTEAGLQSNHDGESMDDPSWGNSTFMDDSIDWQQRRHNLEDYIGEVIMIRFRMDNDGLEVMDLTPTYPNLVSAWLADIRVMDE